MATISIADNDARVQYTQAVTADTTQLTIDFPFFDLDDINVIVTNASGTDTTLTRGTGTGTFAVTGTAVDDGYSGGHITLGDSYSDTSTKYTIFRKITVERTTDFPTSGPFNISSLNTELDKIFAIEQELQDKLNRTVKLADSDTSATLSLPNLDTRKGTTLAFNSTTGLPEAGPKIGDVSSIAAITADISTLADIEDGTDATDAIQTVASISGNVSTVAGVSTNVTTVAGISSNVTTVAGIESDVTTVAGKATEIGRLGTADAVADMNTLGTAAIVSDMDTLADISTDITAVANKASFITADFVSDLNTLAVTDVVNDINLLATSDIVSDLNTLATSDIVSDLNTLATTDIVSDINLLATSDIVADLNQLATSDFVADLNQLADAAIIADMDALADITGNITTVADNISDVNNFADTYFISATAPSSPTLGDLWFDTTNNIMKVYGSGGFVNAGSNVNGTANRYNWTVGTADGDYDGSTTVFPATYDSGYVDVYLNGVKLVVTDDFTATNGTSITLSSAASTGDVVDIVGYGTFTATTALSLGDNEKIQLGAGNDLQIYHDGNSSVIKDAGTGNLELLSSAQITLWNADRDSRLAEFRDGEYVRLYHNGSEKLETTSTGVDVTGEIQADSLDIDGAGDITGNLILHDKLGIGESNPSKAVVISEDDAECVMIIKSSDTGTAGIYLGDQSDEIVGGITYDNTNELLQLRSSNNNVAVSINSSENVGIGTTSPDTKLHVEQSGHAKIKVESTGTNASIEIHADSGGDNKGHFRISGDPTSSGGLFIYDETNSAERLRIDNDGYLHIGGGSSANANLNIVTGNNARGIQICRLSSGSIGNGDVIGSYAFKGTDSANSNAAAEAKIEALASEAHSGSAAGTHMRFFTKPNGTGPGSAPAERLRIESGGDVGIGTTSPNGKLHVKDSSNINMASSVQGQLVVEGSGYTSGIALNGVGMQIYHNSSSRSIILGTNETERFRVTGGGNVYIGDGGFDASSDSFAHFHNPQTHNYPRANFYKQYSGNVYGLRFYHQSSSVGGITYSNTATSYLTSSDHRLKENVEDMTGAITRVKQLQPRRFSWIEDDEDSANIDGFLAHEAQTVVPEAVTGTHNEVDDDGNPEYQAIDQSKLVPLLTGALQEAITKIETLETEMTALKARVTTLENE